MTFKVPGNSAYCGSDNGCVPASAVTLMVQLPLQLDGALTMLTDGGESPQWCTSSVALDLEPPLLPPFTNISIEKALESALLSVFLARAGVQSVAILLDTMSMVWLPLFLALPVYHDGNKSALGLGSCEPIPT